MNALVAYSINGNDFILSPERLLYWEQEKSLIIADLHIGKSGHFRKSGIPVPQGLYKDDLHRLFSQILQFKAERLIIAGDLTHSSMNKELELFAKWRNDLKALNIHLISGNHDVLDEQWYRDLNIEKSDHLALGSFYFCHDPAEIKPEIPLKKYYSFCGHVHPGIVMKGKGRQQMKFPCFYFKNHFAILPAFSKFSGMKSIAPSKGENVFAIMEKGLLQVA